MKKVNKLSAKNQSTELTVGGRGGGAATTMVAVAKKKSIPKIVRIAICRTEKSFGNSTL